MLRFDKAILFSPIVKSNLLVSLSIKTCDSEIFTVFWFHKYGIHFYVLMDLSPVPLVVLYFASDTIEG